VELPLTPMVLEMGHYDLERLTKPLNEIPANQRTP
jgi:hypothetical protein